MIVNLSEAKAKLSKLVDMAYHGEEIIIAKNNLPLVKLVSYNPKADFPCLISRREPSGKNT